MSGVQTNRVDVAFETHQYPDGRPFIALLLSRDGGAVAYRDRLFTLDLVANMTVEEAMTLARALNQCVTQLGMTTTGGPKEEP
jgi:hypothetical protein